MFSFIYHFTRLQILLFFNYCKYWWNQEVPIENIIQIKEEIKNCGFVVIKLCQWSLPRLEILYDYKNEEWFKILEDVYEDCIIHSETYTKEIYNLTFGSQFDEKYEIMEVIGSGSIGQVYKIRDKEDHSIKAMKCKHPGTNYYYYYCMFMIKSICILLTGIKRIHYRIFPIELDAFFESLSNQVYLSNEANNMEKMRNNFLESNYIVVPKVYESNDDIIVMEYINAIRYEDIDDTLNNKYKIAFIFFLSIRQMLIVDNFIHGDLHKGNWKVMIDMNSKFKYKIVLFDTGHCFSIPKAVEVFEALEENNSNKIINIIHNVCDDVYEREKNETEDIIKEELSKNLVRPIDNKKLIQNIFKICKNRGFIVNGYFLSISIILDQTTILFKKYLLYQDNTLNNELLVEDEKIFKEIMVKKEYPNIISFCETYDIFPELVKYYEERIEEQNIVRTGIFESCNFSEIIDPKTAIME